jgi:DNA mismatch endonuclease Vsr
MQVNFLISYLVTLQHGRRPLQRNTQQSRSYREAAIKGKNTKPEMLVRKFLHANGYRYKLHDKSLPGKPDIVLPKYKYSSTFNECVLKHTISSFSKKEVCK